MGDPITQCRLHCQVLERFAAMIDFAFSGSMMGRNKVVTRDLAIARIPHKGM
ncbi:hypothetical protein [Arthrobacter sp. NicSoilC5]|uniref:hypothetical protein n=1 Tax=Arthrobacter sp. NicSoilC5 TaxID=2831000 RepID=UPI001CC71281|nr:hypothetical protein [Arthrobacter sp. NicSoilC5]BCW78906.1 hypothetical protein NicSoilC5_09250 [Arthrobacter sp. NicSoilC5]